MRCAEALSSAVQYYPALTSAVLCCTIMPYNLSSALLCCAVLPFTCQALSSALLSFHLPAERSPLLCWIILPVSVLSSDVLSNHNLCCPLLYCPALTCLALTFAVLCCSVFHVLSSSVMYCPALTCPLLTSAALSCPKLVMPYHGFRDLTEDGTC
jgi:hypothetical protein